MSAAVPVLRLLGGTDPIGYAKITNGDPAELRSISLYGGTPHVLGTTKLLRDGSKLYGTDD